MVQDEKTALRRDVWASVIWDKKQRLFAAPKKSLLFYWSFNKNEPRNSPRLVLKVWENFISCRSVASTFHDKVISCHASDISSKNRTHHFEFFHHNVSDIFLVILTAHPIDISSKGTHNNMGRYIRCFRIRYCRHRISCRKIYRDTYRFLSAVTRILICCF